MNKNEESTTIVIAHVVQTTLTSAVDRRACLVPLGPEDPDLAVLELEDLGRFAPGLDFPSPSPSPSSSSSLSLSPSSSLEESKERSLSFSPSWLPSPYAEPEADPSESELEEERSAKCANLTGCFLLCKKRTGSGEEEKEEGQNCQVPSVE